MLFDNILVIVELLSKLELILVLATTFMDTDNNMMTAGRGGREVLGDRKR